MNSSNFWPHEFPITPALKLVIKLKVQIDGRRFALSPTTGSQVKNSFIWNSPKPVAHFAKYYSNPRGVDEVINAVGLTDKSAELIRTLSGGQRRRLDVALGIIGSPELLFLDEPTTGFDPEARRAFWALIQDLRKSGATILLTTHYLDEAEALADRVAVINQGKIIEVATPALLGGRATSLATVSWKGANGLETERTDNPTALIRKLTETYKDEIPELTVKRASLEDIYLEMIGGADVSE